MKSPVRARVQQGNPWYYIPFIIWVMVGGLMQFFYSQEELFQFFNSQHSDRLDALMEFVTLGGEGIFIALVSVCLFLLKPFRSRLFLFIASLSPLIVFVLSRIIKMIFNASRPLAIYGSEGWFHIKDDWARLYHFSFPSGHTSSAFALFAMLALFLPQRWKMFGLHFFILAFLVGISRMYLAAHFFLDVYAGSILGTLVAFTVARILAKKVVIETLD